MIGRRLTALVLYALTLALVLAPVASASESPSYGRGLYGATNDKVVTDAGFILIIFFPTFIFVMSMIQRHLEKRKEARKAAQKAHLAQHAVARRLVGPTRHPPATR